MTPFADIGLPIAFDVDVLLGAYPDRDEPARDPTATRPVGDPAAVRAALRCNGIAAGAAAHLRAALFDARAGNDDVRAAADDVLVPVGVVDLRDPLGGERELGRLHAAGVRAVRLFPDEQGVEADYPAVRAIARRAAALGFVVLTGGDVRRFWRPYAGLDATVVFLDTHGFHAGDFVVVARDEPGFHTSTRLLNTPDAVETVAAHVGVRRLLFGSRTPYEEAAVPRLRLARCGLSPDDVGAVAGGTARRLLGLAP